MKMIPQQAPRKRIGHGVDMLIVFAKEILIVIITVEKVNPIHPLIEDVVVVTG
jgi:hypothetical protein